MGPLHESINGTLQNNVQTLCIPRQYCNSTEYPVYNASIWAVDENINNKTFLTNMTNKTDPCTFAG